MAACLVGQRSEQLNALPFSLLEEMVDADIAAIEAELEELVTPGTPPATKKKPKRSELPRTGIRHEPESDHCPCGKKKTHKAYLWAYATTPYADLKAVIYDFAPGRGGQHARDFLDDWQGKLICDDYSGYKQSFANGVTEVGCMAHTRRKFVDLHVAGKSQIAEQAIELIGQLYRVEREAQSLTATERQRLRDTRARPIADALHRWMLAHREKRALASALAAGRLITREG